MSLQFTTNSYNKGAISYGNITLETPDGTTVNISVSNEFQLNEEDEEDSPINSKDDTFNKLRLLLNGEPAGSVNFYSNNGESLFSLDFTKDNFFLMGGEYGPSFGSCVTLNCSYSKNKETIDKFMKFLLDEL